MEMPVRSIVRICIGLAVLALITAGAGPGHEADAFARSHGFTRAILRGADFDHVVYARSGTGNTLHVYLENDGLPWLRRYLVAADPTSDRPLMLQLMVVDPAAVLYLGRPCYFGEAHIPPCMA